MPVKLFIASMFLLIMAGCFTAAPRYKIYLGEDPASRYESDTISARITEQFPDVKLLDYQSSGYLVLKGSFNEDVKRAGIILSAKSVFTRHTEQQVIFGNGADSSFLNYSLTEISTREGRSATTSVLNFTDAVKGMAYEPQRQPYTYTNKKNATGTIAAENLTATFNFEHVFNRQPEYSGWLVLNSDTLFVRPVQKLVDEKAVVHDAGKIYLSGFELVKGGQVCAAFTWSFEKKEVFILKQLMTSEKNVIAAFLFIATCCH